MGRIHLYVHGRGQGHATRCLAVGRALEAAGHAVQVFAGPDAHAVLAAALPTEAVASLPPSMSRGGLVTLVGRLRSDRARLRRDRPAVVISDGDLPGAAAARTLGIPVVAIGHGLTFLCCEPPAHVDRDAWRREAIKAWVASAPAQRLIAVNFTPLRVRRADATLARPSLALPPRGEPEPGKVVCYFRDAPVLEALRALLRQGRRPRVYARQAPGLPGIEHRVPDRAQFVADLATAEAVVASAGSQLISECAALGVPFFGLHRPGDDEQALNVAMLRAAGLGDGGPSDGFDPARLGATVQRKGTPSSFGAPTVAEAAVQACRELAGG